MLLPSPGSPSPLREIPHGYPLHLPGSPLARSCTPTLPLSLPALAPPLHHARSSSPPCGYQVARGSHRARRRHGGARGGRSAAAWRGVKPGGAAVAVGGSLHGGQPGHAGEKAAARARCFLLSPSAPSRARLHHGGDYSQETLATAVLARQEDTEATTPGGGGDVSSGGVWRLRHYGESGGVGAGDFFHQDSGLGWNGDSGIWRRDSRGLHGICSAAMVLKNLYLSCDPYMRGYMSRHERPSYLSDFVPGKDFVGFGVSKVVASGNPDFNVGDPMWGMTGWEEYNTVDPATKLLFNIKRSEMPLSYYTGVLAADAVGQIVGQLAKLTGCYVVGSAGCLVLMRSSVGFQLKHRLDHALSSNRSLLDHMTFLIPPTFG